MSAIFLWRRETRLTFDWEKVLLAGIVAAVLNLILPRDEKEEEEEMEEGAEQVVHHHDKRSHSEEDEKVQV